MELSVLPPDVGSCDSVMQVYEKKGEINNAIDAAIEYVDKDSDPSWRYLINVGKKNLNYAVANMRAKMKTSEHPVYWRALIAELYYSAGKYELALKENIKLEEEAGKDERIHSRYLKMGREKFPFSDIYSIEILDLP